MVYLQSLGKSSAWMLMHNRKMGKNPSTHALGERDMSENRRLARGRKTQEENPPFKEEKKRSP